MILSPRSFLATSAMVVGVIVFGAWLYAHLMPMGFLESGYPIWVAKQAILRDCSFGSVLVMGDSRAEAAIIPSELPFPAANTTFGGTTPIETYFFAREAMKCPNPPRVVIYSHSMPAYLRPNEGLWKTATRYGYINFRDLREVANLAAQQHDPSLASVNTHDGLTGVVRDLTYGTGFPSIFMASLIEARGIGRYDHNERLLEQTAVTKGHVVYNQPPQKRLVGTDAAETIFAPSALEGAYLDKTLDLFAGAHVRTLLLTIPAAEATVRAVSPRLRTAFSSFLAAHMDRYRSVVADAPELLAWPDDLYVDGSHMNERGATVFTARLAACLRQWDDKPDRPPPCAFDWK